MPSHPAPAPAPPPPPPCGSHQFVASGITSQPKPPSVDPNGPAGAFLVELLIYNGAPFKDNWAYWVRSHCDPEMGVLTHATGDVKNGFQLETKRNHDFRTTGNRPIKTIPLQWIDGKYFDESAMFNDGVNKIDTVLVCAFEASLHKVKAPGKSLTTVDDKKWVIESANQLVIDGILTPTVAEYLRAIEQ
ncbi:hypothetical protein EsDP_00007382 [Epichloe bromicola]|uniref:Uncharacterized protein n=1 Tax=Epichloe bromicola TaxID=79588 RepID=A0ABQ0D0C8_9HYPO